MYVCICNTVRESDLDRAASLGLSFEQFRAETGCAQTCGTCREDADAMYSAALVAVKAAKRQRFMVPVLNFS
jgi:bacterioferritin-associated ferredoxin